MLDLAASISLAAQQALDEYALGKFCTIFCIFEKLVLHKRGGVPSREYFFFYK
jgi:hypothetical protein